MLGKRICHSCHSCHKASLLVTPGPPSSEAGLWKLFCLLSALHVRYQRILYHRGLSYMSRQLHGPGSCSGNSGEFLLMQVDVCLFLLPPRPLSAADASFFRLVASEVATIPVRFAPGKCLCGRPATHVLGHQLLFCYAFFGH